MKLYKFTFITIVLTTLACYGQHVDPNAELVFNQLKPELLELFPESLLVRTEYVPSIKFDGNVSISEVSYVLSNVTASVSKETQDRCEDRLRDPFLKWLKYSDTLCIESLSGCFGGTHWGSNPAESDLASSDKIPSSSLYFYDEQSTLCFQLKIEFIERKGNLLIIRCRLILNLPPPSKIENNRNGTSG